MDSQAPKSIGRYAIHRELASGGMASVFYARLIGPQGFARTVVVKRPHPQLVTQREFAMMFIDEARVASRIRHPNVVSTLDVIETSNDLALVMDYVHGESLSRLVTASRERERIPLPIAAAIVLDMLAGLHAAHEAKDEKGQPLDIVHRDVSPQNVIVGADGVTRIVDFGIAKAAGRLLTTRDGAIKGKYAYMAPEQVRGERVTRRTDVYATAIVFWELLTGARLFRGGTEAEEIYKALEHEAAAPSAVAPDVPKEIDAIVLRGLARDPEKRYPNARAMAVDLERAIPAVRASEVSAWVERLAGETLAERAAVIAEMESSSPDVTARAGDAETVSAPSGSSRAGGAGSAGGRRSGEVAAATPRSVSSTLPSRAQEIASQVSHPGVVAESRAVRSRTSRRTIAVVAVLALVGVAFSVRSLVGHGPQPLSLAAEAGPSLATSASSVADAGATAGLPAAASSSPVVADSSVPAPPTSSSAKPAPHGGGHGARSPQPGCDPPYTVDARGRKIFKLECL